MHQLIIFVLKHKTKNQNFHKLCTSLPDLSKNPRSSLSPFSKIPKSTSIISPKYLNPLRSLIYNLLLAISLLLKFELKVWGIDIFPFSIIFYWFSSIFYWVVMSWPLFWLNYRLGLYVICRRSSCVDRWQLWQGGWSKSCCSRRALGSYQSPIFHTYIHIYRFLYLLLLWFTSILCWLSFRLLRLEAWSQGSIRGTFVTLYDSLYFVNCKIVVSKSLYSLHSPRFRAVFASIPTPIITALYILHQPFPYLQTDTFKSC